MTAPARLMVVEVPQPYELDDVAPYSVINENFRRIRDKITEWSQSGALVPDELLDQFVKRDGSTPLTATWDAVYGITSDWIQFDTDYSDGHVEGRLQWNSDDGTLEVGMPGGNVNLQIGQEFLVRAKNVSGVTAPNGTVVYNSGVSGQRPTFDYADASDEAKSHRIGVTTEGISNNQLGFINLLGIVRDLNTSSFSEGDTLWLSATTPGALTNVSPSAPNHKVVVGFCMYSHASEGIIYVYPNYGKKVDELDDVYLPSLADQDLLVYVESSQRWESTSFDGVGKKTGWDQDYAQDGLTTISVVDGTRTVSIAPTGSDFSFWIEGTKYTKSITQSVTFADTEGIWFIYFDSTGTLVSSQTPWDITANDWAGVCVLYWDAFNNTTIYLGPEYHSWVMDPGTHHYLHYTMGTRWESGLACSEVTANTIDVTPGKIHDEDIEIDIQDVASPTGVWEQDLSPASMPIFYRDGVAGDWRKIAASTTLSYVLSNIPQVNTPDGGGPGVWGWSGVASNRYYAYWVVATNDQTTPVILVPGQEASDTLLGATSGNQLSDMQFGDLPTAEHKVIARLILRRQTTSPYYQITQIDDYRNAVDEPSGGGSVVNHHGNLTGLTDDDHVQYVLASGLREWDEQASDPTTPATDKWNLFFKSGGLYVQDDAGTVTGPLGTGGGGGSSPLTTKGDLYTYDTADARLPVGTTGQVLQADPATATGLKWATNSPTLPLTTKGDILGYDSSTNRVPVGSDGQVLTADSTAALGVAWKTPSGGGSGGSPPDDFDLLTDGVDSLVFAGGDVVWVHV